MLKEYLDLQLFAEGGAAAGGGEGAAAPAGAEGAGQSAVTDNAIREGMVLEDGTRVDRRLAERMERQRKRHPEKQYPAAQPVPQQEAQKQQDDPADPDKEWEDLKKGRFASQYGRDVQAAVNDRFKNQANLQQQLDGLKPMLDALANQRGIKAGDYDALSKAILDDDSLYEDEAEAHGMTIEAYKSYKALEAEAEQARAQRQQNEQQMYYQNHLRKLVEQAEQLKQTIPDLNLQKELENPNFRRMVDPSVGLSVEDAYYAVHHAEIGPKAVMAGVQHAQRQIAQSLQANAGRPVEGAMTGNQAAAHIGIDIRSMTREQRRQLTEDMRRRKARGERVTLD